MTTLDDSIMAALCPPVDLPDDLAALRSVVHRFVDDHLIPHEQYRTLPLEAREKMLRAARDIGLFAVDVPAKYGGSGLGSLGYVVVSEELARSTLYEDCHWLGYTIGGLLKHATPEQSERYVRRTVTGEIFGAFAMTEATGGSDPAAHVRTTAVRQGDKWVLNGRKVFASNADIADYILVVAMTDAGKRQHGGMTAFLVDRETPGFSVIRTIETMGDDHDPSEIDFQDAVVDDAQRVGEVGAGFVVAQHSVASARRWIGAHAVGRCMRLLELIRQYAPTREVQGTAVPELGQAQAAVANIVIDMETTRWLTYRCAAMADRDQDTRVFDSIVKVYGSEAMCRAVDTGLQLFGGWGLTKEFPVERMYREARRWRIVDGPNEVHRMLISREVFRHGIAAP